MLRYGVLYWGISVAVIWSLAMGVLEGWNQFPFLLIGALIIFPIGGYFWAGWTWRRIEAQYRQRHTRRIGRINRLSLTGNAAHHAHPSPHFDSRQ